MEGPQLLRAKEVLEACDFVSPSTKGCYSSRIATWIHFCNTFCGGDDIITERRLADYVEWLVSSGAADRIRQGTTHIQQVLRNQLQGVLCYWRIQNGGRTDVDDPRLGPIFIERWQQIAMRHPRPRQARRAEPIYGAHRLANSPDRTSEPRHQQPGTITNISHINGNSPPGSHAHASRPPLAPAAPGIASRPLPPADASRPGYTSSMPSHQQYPPGPTGEARLHSRRSPPRPHPYYADGAARHPYDAQPQYRPQPPVASSPSSRMSLPSAPTQPFAYPNKPTYPATTSLAQPPRQLHSPHTASKPEAFRLAPTNMAADAARPPTEAPRHTSPRADNAQAQRTASQASTHARQSRTGSIELTPRPATPQTETKAMVEEPCLQGRMPEAVPIWEGDVADASAAAPGGHLLNTSEAVALSIRQLAASTGTQIQARAHCMLGMATWLPAAARSTLTLADIAVEEPFGAATIALRAVVHQAADSDVGASVDADGDIVIGADDCAAADSGAADVDASVAVAAVTDAVAAATVTNVEAEASAAAVADAKVNTAVPAEVSADVDASVPAEADVEAPANVEALTNVEAPTDVDAAAPVDVSAETNTAADADVNTEANADADSNAGTGADAEMHAASESTTATELPLKAIAVALRSSASKDSRTVALRHANPLLCSWGALAMCLFEKWHVANEAAPDFSTTAWQSQHLFPAIAGGPAPADDDFARVFAGMVAEITNDKIDGAQAMSDAGFFFADAHGLVRPTATGIKGLDAVNAIDASALQPSVLLALARANAGFGADTAEPAKAPGRFEVLPSQSLLKEVFPWLKTVLFDAFRQNTNNDDVQAARRILQVLRELRTVLLQDVAFLMEVPTVADAVKDSPLFGHALFSSPEFMAFRATMRCAIGDSEIKSAEMLCAGALVWTDKRKQQMPEGAADRLQPTAPRLRSPSCTAVPSGSEADVADGMRKRPLETGGTPGAEAQRQASAAPADPAASPKRARRENSTASSLAAGRIFGETAVPAPAGAPATAAVATAVAAAVATATAEPAASSAPSAMNLFPAAAGMARAIGELRTENEDLKAHVRRLEWMLNQNKAEMRTWMQRVDGAIRRFGSVSSRPASPPETPAQHHPSMAAHDRQSMGMHRQQVSMAPPTKFSGPSSQQAPYASGSYHEPPAPNGSQAAPPPGARDSMPGYERQPGMYSVRQSPALSQRTQLPQAPGEFRPTDPGMAAPRNAAYAPRRAPGEYPDHHYNGYYAGPHSRPSAPGYGFSEHPAYPRHHDAPYAGTPRIGDSSLPPRGRY
ncbi:hypothetical protein LPJ61_000124 [Coemansia biformis]|uniref:Ndc10 domain-containing protein n=1 Tax=Coemansia biformis TaxID=1286918 RepID=A0A9W7YJE6_9FUNG|nr:hypothetical protein LPJ61_000124 [Coemansia biformis]